MARRIVMFILLAMLLTGFSMNKDNHYKMLCLGDSYTIGEAVEEQERFPMQTVELLKQHGIVFDKPTIIAKTGWTTDELAVAIKEANYQAQAGEYVTLLIGVNNQYRDRSTDEYCEQFIALLNTAIKYAGGNASHVFVLSIPDWGQTPFAANDRRSRADIGKAIDQFNAINKQEALKLHAHYIDITPISRQVNEHADYIATDGLHPSGKMYAEWAKLLSAEIQNTITSK